MSHLLKDIYSESFYNKFSRILNHSLPSFNKEKFKGLIFNNEFGGYELKERMTHTASVLNHFLPDDFEKAVRSIIQIIENLRLAGFQEDSFEFMFFPAYIAMFGIDDCKSSIPAIEFITQFTSCEFAVRPFILKYEEKMIDRMLLWSKHGNYLVRRLSSEGSRPRLPWAMALPNLKKNPGPILPILENLKQDSSEVVRRSVANNLNDISKDNPEIVIELAKKWKGISKETDSLIKHACRTMLKQGNSDILKLFGFDSSFLELSGFKIETPKVSLGSKLEFSFSVLNKSRKDQMMRLEYGLYYQKKNGTLSKKVFKISERNIEPDKIYSIKRKQSFKLITTRTFYTGMHKLSIIINGQENKKKEFELIN